MSATVRVVWDERPERAGVSATSRERESSQAFLVVALTLACTALAIFDLLLLAGGF